MNIHKVDKNSSSMAMAFLACGIPKAHQYCVGEYILISIPLSKSAMFENCVCWERAHLACNILELLKMFPFILHFSETLSDLEYVYLEDMTIMDHYIIFLATS